MTATHQKNELLDAALIYARRGWRVHPLRGKIPTLVDWPNIASTDERAMRQWFAGRPTPNVGIATGTKSGIFVIDIDGVFALPSALQNLPRTISVKTPRGCHFYFAYPRDGTHLGNWVGIANLKIDVRGENGNIVAPPSIHPVAGIAYEWINPPWDAELAELPADVIAWLIANKPASASRVEADGQVHQNGKPHVNGKPWAGRATNANGYGAAALAQECAALASTARGGRNDQLFRAAAALAELVAGGELDGAAVDVQLFAAAERCGLVGDDGEASVRRTIASGAAAGARNPRTAPPKTMALPVYQTSIDGAPQGADQEVTFRNYSIAEVEVKKGETTKTESMKVGLPAIAISEKLAALTDGWPRRVGRLLFVPDSHSPVYLEDHSQLFGWIARALQRAGNEKTNPIQWTLGDDKLGQKLFDAYLRQTVPNYSAVNAYPHEPIFHDHFYLHPEPKPAYGAALRGLLERFNPSTDVDRALVLAFFLTLFWGGQPGQRPGFLFTAPEADERAGRGVGKTTLVKMGAHLVGGFISCGASDSMDDVKKRMFSPEGRGRRILLVDNVKSHKFSWAELEDFITADTISGRQLYVGEGRLPNTYTTCITVNGATLSKDLAQRCVVVQVKRPTYSATWEEDTIAMIDQRRWEIIGDLIQILSATPKPLDRYSRWGAWEAGVLSHVNNAAECQNVVETRQAAIDDDQDEQDLIREAFREAMVQRGYCPDSQVVLFPSRLVAGIVEQATNEKRATNKTSAYLRTLGITELRKSNRATARGWIWHGKNAPSGTTAMQWR